MYIVREDMDYLREHNAGKLKHKYREKFGENFLFFNYIDFPSTETKIAAQVYVDALEEALAKDEPTRIVSHRYDFCDH